MSKLSLAEHCKAKGFKSVNEVAELSTRPRRTLQDWFNNEPAFLEVVLDGCLIKKNRYQKGA